MIPSSTRDDKRWWCFTSISGSVWSASDLVVNHTLEVQKPLNEWSFGKDYFYFSRDCSFNGRWLPGHMWSYRLWVGYQSFQHDRWLGKEFWMWLSLCQKRELTCDTSKRPHHLDTSKEFLVDSKLTPFECHVDFGFSLFAFVIFVFRVWELTN